MYSSMGEAGFDSLRKGWNKPLLPLLLLSQVASSVGIKNAGSEEASDPEPSMPQEIEKIVFSN